MTKKVYDGFCPIRHILDRMGDKWSMLILTTIHSEGVIRFGELGRAIPDISQKMLTSTLRTLEADGYISREIFPEIPPRVEYRMTPLGKTLIPHINGLIEWASAHRSDVLFSRDMYTAACSGAQVGGDKVPEQ